MLLAAQYSPKLTMVITFAADFPMRQLSSQRGANHDSDVLQNSIVVPAFVEMAAAAAATADGIMMVLIIIVFTDRISSYYGGFLYK